MQPIASASLFVKWKMSLYLFFVVRSQMLGGNFITCVETKFIFCRGNHAIIRWTLERIEPYVFEKKWTVLERSSSDHLNEGFKILHPVMKQLNTWLHFKFLTEWAFFYNLTESKAGRMLHLSDDSNSPIEWMFICCRVLNLNRIYCSAKRVEECGRCSLWTNWALKKVATRHCWIKIAIETSVTVSQ